MTVDHSELPNHSRFSLRLKSLAWALVLCLIGQDVVWAQGETPFWQSITRLGAGSEKSAADGTINIPAEDGLIRRRIVNGNETIINIQDAHQKIDAQRSIARILDNLVQDYKLEMVAVEGGIGRIDTSLLSAYPSKNVRRLTGDYLLSEGRISAAELYSIVSEKPVRIEGVEEKATYDRNVEVFGRIIERKLAVRAELTRLNRAARQLQAAVYPAELGALLDKRIQHKSGSLKFAEYWQAYGEAAARRGIDVSVYPNLSRLADVVRLENQIDFRLAEKQRTALQNELSTKLDKEDLQTLIIAGLQFKQNRITPGRFHFLLGDAAERSGVDAQRYPDLIRYTEYLLIFEGIDLVTLFDEMTAFEESVAAGYLTTEDQKSLYELLRRARVLTDLLDTTLDSKAYGYLKAHADACSVSAVVGGLSALGQKHGVDVAAQVDRGVLEEAVPDALLFYELAERRNKEMLDNTVRKMRSQGAHVAALVTGGFHSEGIAELMSGEKLSHLVVMPKFDSGGADRPYIAVLTKKPKSFEEQFKGSDFYLAPPYVFDLAGGLNRDAQLRDLAASLAQGRLSVDGPEGPSAARGDLAERYKAAYELLGEQAVSAGRLTPTELKKLLETARVQPMGDSAVVVRLGGRSYTFKVSGSGSARRITGEAVIRLADDSQSDTPKISLDEDPVARRRRAAARLAETPQTTDDSSKSPWNIIAGPTGAVTGVVARLTSPTPAALLLKSADRGNDVPKREEVMRVLTRVKSIITGMGVSGLPDEEKKKLVSELNTLEESYPNIVFAPKGESDPRYEQLLNALDRAIVTLSKQNQKYMEALELEITRIQLLQEAGMGDFDQEIISGLEKVKENLEKGHAVRSATDSIINDVKTNTMRAEAVRKKMGEKYLTPAALLYSEAGIARFSLLSDQMPGPEGQGLRDTIDTLRDLMSEMTRSEDVGAQSAYELDWGSQSEPDKIVLFVKDNINSLTFDKIWRLYGHRIVAIIAPQNATSTAHWVILAQGLTNRPLIATQTSEDNTYAPGQEITVGTATETLTSASANASPTTGSSPAGIPLYVNLTGSDLEATPGREADGIGLIRTELLTPELELAIKAWLGAGSAEEATLEAELVSIMVANYTAKLRGMDGKPVTFRTFDFQLDKDPGGLLELLAPRQTVNNQPQTQPTGFDVYRTPGGERLLRLQLQALSQVADQAARPDGGGAKIKVMFPMVSNKEDLDLVHNRVLRKEKSPQIEWGVMVETLEAIDNIKEILTHDLGIRFVSVGLSDLTSAIWSKRLSKRLWERLSKRLPARTGHEGAVVHVSRELTPLARLYDRLHPVVLREVSRLVEAMDEHNSGLDKAARPISCGFCGPLADTPEFNVYLSYLKDIVNQTPLSASMSWWSLPNIRNVWAQLARHATPETKVSSTPESGEARGSVADFLRYLNKKYQIGTAKDDKEVHETVRRLLETLDIGIKESPEGATAGARLAAGSPSSFSFSNGVLGRHRGALYEALEKHLRETFKLTSEKSKRVANSLVRARPEVLDYWLSWGVLSKEEHDLLMKYVPGRKQDHPQPPQIQAGFFQGVVDQLRLYDTPDYKFTDDQKTRLQKRLLPLAHYTQIVGERVPSWVVFSILKNRFALINHIPEAQVWVNANQNTVGGSGNAWKIVIGQGLKGANEFAASARDWVNANQATVGGSIHAWAIVINQGLKGASRFVASAEGWVDDNQNTVGGPRNAWHIVINQGLKGANEFAVSARGWVNANQANVGGPANAWAIVIIQGLKGADDFVASARGWVNANQALVGGPRTAWDIVIGRGIKGATAGARLAVEVAQERDPFETPIEVVVAADELSGERRIKAVRDRLPVKFSDQFTFRTLEPSQVDEYVGTAQEGVYRVLIGDDAFEVDDQGLLQPSAGVLERLVAIASERQTRLQLQAERTEALLSFIAALVDETAVLAPDGAVDTAVLNSRIEDLRRILRDLPLPGVGPIEAIGIGSSVKVLNWGRFVAEGPLDEARLAVLLERAFVSESDQNRVSAVREALSVILDAAGDTEATNFVTQASAAVGAALRAYASIVGRQTTLTPADVREGDKAIAVMDATLRGNEDHYLGEAVYVQGLDSAMRFVVVVPITDEYRGLAPADQRALYRQNNPETGLFEPVFVEDASSWEAVQSKIKGPFVLVGEESSVQFGNPDLETEAFLMEIDSKAESHRGALIVAAKILYTGGNVQVPGLSKLSKRLLKYLPTVRPLELLKLLKEANAKISAVGTAA